MQLADPLASERGKNPALAFESATQGLDLLLDHVDSDKPLSVLDLGSPNQAVVDMFYGMRVRLHMGDLLRGVGWSHDQNTPHKAITADIVADTLSHVEGQHFDAILTWDLFNYFRPQELKIILEHVNGLSHVGTLLHSLVFAGSEMPQAPSRLTPTRRRRLRYEPTTQQTVVVDTALAKLLNDTLPNYKLTESSRFGEIFDEQLRQCKKGQSAVA